MKKVLIVDDDKNFCESLKLEFEDYSHYVEVAHSISDLRCNVSLNSFDWAIVDLRIATDNGLDVVELLKEKNTRMEIVVLTGFGSITTAVEAIKRGAKQYLSKPVQFDEILDCFEGSHEVNNEDSYPSLARKEREYIEFVLNECDGNISLAAKKLGLHRQSLQRKLKKYTPLK